MYKNKRLLALLLVFVLSLSLVGCQSDKPKEEGQEKNGKVEENKEYDEKIVLKVATSGTFFPVIFTEDDKLQGFEYDVWEEIAKRINAEIKWEIISGMDGMFGNLDNGRIDSIAGQISITPERQKKYRFGEIYAYNEIKLVVRNDDPAENIDDMRGRKVCIEPSSVLSEFVDNYNEGLKEGEEQIIPIVTEGSIYEELELGRIDAFPMTVLSFSQVKEKGDYDVKMIGDAMIVEENAFPFSEDVDDETIGKINKAIKDMHEDGTLSKLSDKWYETDVTKDKLS